MRDDFAGTCVALATPFRADGAVDVPAFRRLVRHVAAGGVDVLVPLGSTGEAATLRDAERDTLITACLEEARDAAVVVGTGSNDTAHAAALTARARALGAHGALVVTPYYNKPSPRGLVLHFSAVAEAVTTPIVLYNVPARTGVDMSPEVVAELGAKFPHVVAVKEALPSLERAKRLVSETPVGVLCGEDGLIADFTGYGGLGVISVLANVMPAETAELVRASVPGGHSVRAAELVERTAPLVKALFVESNPVPVKAALSACLPGYSEEVRLPLAPLTARSRAELAHALARSGLVK